MNLYRKYLTIIGVVLFANAGSLVAQNLRASQPVETETRSVGDYEYAKDSTYELHKVVNLQSDQISKVNSLFLELRKRDGQMPEDLDEKSKSAELKKLDTYKMEKLKELLSEVQYDSYLKFKSKMKE